MGSARRGAVRPVGTTGRVLWTEPPSPLSALWRARSRHPARVLATPAPCCASYVQTTSLRTPTYETRSDMLTTTLEDLVPALGSADRCDRCGARARVRATLISGQELLFCAHHARRHQAALLARGATWQDETAALAS